MERLEEGEIAPPSTVQRPTRFLVHLHCCAIGSNANDLSDQAIVADPHKLVHGHTLHVLGHHDGAGHGVDLADMIHGLGGCVGGNGENRTRGYADERGKKRQRGERGRRPSAAGRRVSRRSFGVC